MKTARTESSKLNHSFSSGAPLSLWACKRNRTLRRTHESYVRCGPFLLCVRENQHRPQDWRTTYPPGADPRCYLRQSTHCQPATPSCTRRSDHGYCGGRCSEDYPRPQTTLHLHTTLQWKDQGIRCRGLGEICARLNCLREWQSPLTSKSLSATLVYHTFAFLLPSAREPHPQGGAPSGWSIYGNPLSVSVRPHQFALQRLQRLPLGFRIRKQHHHKLHQSHR